MSWELRCEVISVRWMTRGREFRVWFRLSMNDRRLPAESVSTGPRVASVLVGREPVGHGRKSPSGERPASTPRGPACHPKDQSEVENPCSALMRGLPRRSPHPRVRSPSLHPKGHRGKLHPVCGHQTQSVATVRCKADPRSTVHSASRPPVNSRRYTASHFSEHHSRSMKTFAYQRHRSRDLSAPLAYACQ